MSSWSPSQSESVYNVPTWGCGYFSINAHGNVQVTPEPGGADIDLFELIGQIRRRGVPAPLLLRFDGILRARVRELHAAFDRAREEFEYSAPYRSVFPIKVNQERPVVEALLQEGRAHGMGLEVGSKAELLAGVALQAGEGALLICNGYKDEEYVEMALLSSQLGIRPILVVEKFTELETILTASERLGIEPSMGVRIKLSFRGAGRWQDSVGDRSKFGLATREVVQLVETLRARGRLEQLELLHFHIGSQITEVRAIKQAMREAVHTLAGLSRMGATIRWFDAGGGLGVDYDGTKTTSDSSRNYSLQEYANDVVWHLVEACREYDLTPPAILTESGRALVAHHAVLVGEVVGASAFPSETAPPLLYDEDPEIVRGLAELCDQIEESNYRECYHDALELRERAMLLFNTGQLSLPDRARGEEFFWRSCYKVLRITRTLEYVPEELAGLEQSLADTYFVNFSLFQSMPDSWAIGQLFPVVPLHRHREEPTRRAVLADLTCDSDGRIDQFIDPRGAKGTLEVHAREDSEAYYVGFFLVGAYQEILGDMHNLFGDTSVVHVDIDATGKPKLVHVIRGDRVSEVLSYVEYFEEDLLRALRGHVEAALEAGRMDFEESALFWRRYEDTLRGTTYLSRRSDAPPPSVAPTESREDSAELTS